MDLPNVSSCQANYECNMHTWNTSRRKENREEKNILKSNVKIWCRKTHFNKFRGIENMQNMLPDNNGIEAKINYVKIT